MYNKSKSPDANGGSQSKREQETYSEEDDRRIIEMKTADPKIQWKDVLAAIDKKSVSDVKAHWKEINPANSGNKSNDKAKKARAEADKAAGLARKAEADAKKAGAPPGGASKVRRLFHTKLSQQKTYDRLPDWIEDQAPLLTSATDREEDE